MSKRASLEVAIQAFAECERVQLLLDKKEKALSDAIVRVPHDMIDEYVKKTTEIENYYEEKREAAGLD